MFSGEGGITHADLVEPPVRYRRSDPAVRAAIWGLAGVSALAGALAPGEPTGVAVADVVWRAAFALLVTLAASRARRWPAVWLAGITTAFSGGLSLALALGSFVAAGMGMFSPHRNRLLGAAAGALAAQALLRLPDLGFHGAATLVATVAVAPVLWSAYDCAHRATRKLIRQGLMVAAAAVALAVGGLGVAMITAYPSLTTAVTRTRTGHQALEQAEMGQAARRFDEASTAYGRAASALNAPWARPARFIPLLSQHRDVVVDTSRAGRQLTQSAADTATVAPYQTLKASAGQVDLATLETMQGPVAKSVATLDEVSAQLNQEHSPWLVPPLAHQIDLFADELEQAVPEAELATRALEAAPAMLGAGGPRRYLVLFTSPAESRFLGGFAGAYGVLNAVDGKVTFDESGNIGDLNQSGDRARRTLHTFEGSDEYEARYARFFPQLFFQNLTVSPDLPTDATVTRDLYQQATGQPIDGVIVADPYALAAFLELTGPVEAEGVAGKITADNVVDYLLLDQYLEYEDQNEARRERLGEVADATFDALTNRDLPGPARIGEVLSPVVARKHLMIWMFDENDQQLFDRMDAGGRFEPGEHDFVSLRTANGGPNKIDSFLSRSLSYNVEFDPTTGATTAEVEIRLENSAPMLLPDYVIGNAFGEPPGTNVMYLSFYSPLQLEAVTSDGYPVPTSTHRELGTNVYSMEVRVPARKVVTIALRLAGVLEPSATYELFASSQPTVNDDQMTVAIRSGADGWTVRRTGDLTGGGRAATWSGVLDEDRSWVAEFTPLP